MPTRRADPPDRPEARLQGVLPKEQNDGEVIRLKSEQSYAAEEFDTAFAKAASELQLHSPRLVTPARWYAAYSHVGDLAADGKTDLPNIRLPVESRACLVSWLWHAPRRRVYCLVGPLVDPGDVSSGDLCDLISALNARDGARGHIVWEAGDASDPDDRGGGVAISTTLVSEPGHIEAQLFRELLKDAVDLAAMLTEELIDIAQGEVE